MKHTHLHIEIKKSCWMWRRRHVLLHICSFALDSRIEAKKERKKERKKRAWWIFIRFTQTLDKIGTTERAAAAAHAGIDL